MQSWIGNTPVDLSEEAWCRVFNLPPVSVEDESFVMRMEKEELFFRLTGIRNLGVKQFIKINQLHQEANVRLTVQVVMTVLVPKKGSKEQVKAEEGRLLYALIYGKPINLAKMIVERLRAAFGRKSVPICYGMHLTEMMAKAGVDLSCAGDRAEDISSIIDHHTLKRLGYKLDFHTWVYVGRGKVNLDPAAEEGDPEEEEAEEHPEDTTQAESTAPSQPHPSRPRPPTAHLASHVSSEVAHLRQFMVEQLHIMQATIMSKLESMDSRLQACEAHLGHPSRTSPTPPPHPSDPKGKAPMVSPITSPVASPTHSPIHISSPHNDSPQASPHLSPSHSSSSSSSSESSQQYELTARTPLVTTHASSSDSEATPSDPALHPSQPHSPSHSPSQPPASTPAMRTKLPAIKNPTFTPSPSSQSTPSSQPHPPAQQTQPSPPPQPTPPTQTTPRSITASYTRRKLAVSRPGAKSPPPPPPPPPQP